MALIIASSHFVPLERVPQIDINTHLANIFSQVSAFRVGGFFLTERERPAYFIQANELASAIFSRLGVESRSLSARRVVYTRLEFDFPYIELSYEVTDPFVHAETLIHDFNTTELIWDRIVERGISDFVDSYDSSLYLLRVADVEINFDTDSLEFSGEMGFVYPVRYMMQNIGWFFPEEKFVQSISTPPPAYVCLRGHRNCHPDSGRCTDKSGCVEPLNTLVRGV